MSGHGARSPGRRVVVRAPAKVNLHLEVLRQRPDGYHDIETVLQAVDLFDTVTVTLLAAVDGPAAQRLQLRVTPPDAAPDGVDNLCWQAVRVFGHATGRHGELEIDLHKEIPAGAGLGGGSADAAAVLVALDRLYGTRLDGTELEQLAAQLGSDVPFFIRGGTQIGRGRGTRLTPLTAIRSGVFLIVKPPLSIETARIYGQLKIGLTVRGPKCNLQHIKALIARFPSSSWFGFNRLEEVVLPAHPVLQRLVLRLQELAPIAMLTGSGAAAVAVFDEKHWASQIQDEFAAPDWFVRVVGPHPAGVEITEE
ncbi:MAG: 4-(cytidine 5'-diphospho)-2-C-methyl-D-erythritol kinase [Candidatus Krumholzibacteriia bacterium]